MSSDPIQGNLVPDLFQPMLEGFSPLAFRLRGSNAFGTRTAISRASMRARAFSDAIVQCEDKG